MYFIKNPLLSSELNYIVNANEWIENWKSPNRVEQPYPKQFRKTISCFAGFANAVKTKPRIACADACHAYFAQQEANKQNDWVENCTEDPPNSVWQKILYGLNWTEWYRCECSVYGYRAYNIHCAQHSTHHIKWSWYRGPGTVCPFVPKA